MDPKSRGRLMVELSQMLTSQKRRTASPEKRPSKSIKTTAEGECKVSNVFNNDISAVINNVIDQTKEAFDTSVDSLLLDPDVFTKFADRLNRAEKAKHAQSTTTQETLFVEPTAPSCSYNITNVSTEEVNPSGISLGISSPPRPSSPPRSSSPNLPRPTLTSPPPSPLLSTSSSFIPPSSPSSIPSSSFPEDFEVDGAPRLEDRTSPEQKRKRKKDVSKFRRNRGLNYTTTSGEEMPQRSIKERCMGNMCERRILACSSISENDRTDIFLAFWKLGDLQSQRNWIARHILSMQPKKKDERSSRKNQTLKYTLPHGSSTIPVCKTMFLNTVAVSERFIRTVLEKTTSQGVVQSENRGGRRNPEGDAVKRTSVGAHINKFPRIESHFCRANSKSEYLSPELTVSKMYAMYQADENGKKVHVSFNFYNSVFRSMNLKFHVPKKDQCGICQTKKNADSTDPELTQIYERHINEKTLVREILKADTATARSIPTISTAIFDLEKVLYLPQSQRGEIFYKRRLSCFNFTIYEADTVLGHCYFWHEAQAGRGANEIASCVYKFLEGCDIKGTERINLFSDRCAGQNKNTILPTMIRHFLKNSNSLKTVSMNFFETNHGQSAGDSIHSLVERTVKRVPEISVPSELVGIIKTAAKAKPFVVTEIQTDDIFDWKSSAAASGILKVRTCEDGMSIKWPDVIQIKLQKENPGHILLKQSHADDFHILSLPERRTQEMPPPKAYQQAPKLSKDKYDDLKSLCSGATPVVSHPDNKNFYLSLHHHG